MKTKNKFKILKFLPIIVAIPTISLISSNCKIEDNYENKYILKKLEITKKISEINNSKNRDKIVKQFLKLTENEKNKNYKDLYSILIQILLEIDNEIIKQNIEPKPNEPKPNNPKPNEPKPNNPKPNPNPLPNNNQGAPTTNLGYEIEYDSSNNFYESLNGLSGQVLRDKLFQLQLKHRNKTGDYKQLYRTYRDAFVDRYYENDGSVLDLYTEIPNGRDKYNFRYGFSENNGGKHEGDGINREHIVPQSWFGKDLPMRNDAHHVWPSDILVNAKHSNYPYGTVMRAKYNSSNGTKIGISYEDNQDVTEVINEFKGDVARVLFYFTLTYRDKNITQNGSSTHFFKPNNEIKDIFLKTMLNWNKMDGISQFDIDRNNGIYKHQHNRNPFTDYPELIKVYFEKDDNYVFKNKGVAKLLVKK